MYVYEKYYLQKKEWCYMNEKDNNLEKILSLSKEELEKIFSQLSIKEIENLLNKLNEVTDND